MVKAVEHTALGNNSFRCLNCGEEYVYAVPVSMSMWTAMAKAYGQEHARCEPTVRGAARMQYQGPREWRTSWDTGVSSISIYDFFTHGTPPRAVPYDPSDFGRCYRLLKVAPAWRARMSELGERATTWKKLCDRWGELEKLYEEELASGTGKAPKLYAAIKECLG